jgi:DNA repair photolyase
MDQNGVKPAFYSLFSWGICSTYTETANKLMTIPHVISASRRTDIPAFYSNWFISRLEAGFALVRQPYSGRYSRVSLDARDVAAIVFWSKNYAPLLPKLERVEETTKNVFFHFTITANRELEPNVPDHEETIRDYLFLSRRYSAEQIIWRFDPICITDELSYEIQEERFAHCAEKLCAETNRCIISFVHPYKKVLANMGKLGAGRLIELSCQKKREYALRLATRAKSYGIRLYACCNDYLLSDRIGKAACIDGRYLSAIFQTQLDTRLASTRNECACTKSIDIGAYDTCAHGCEYCYAISNQDRAQAARMQHNPEWNALNAQVDGKDIEYRKQQDALLL